MPLKSIKILCTQVRLATGVNQLMQQANVAANRFTFVAYFFMSIRDTCIIGIGNSLRTDDGAGAYVCSLMEKENLPAVTFMVVQQLDASMAEELSKFDRVLFIDAAEGETSFSLKSLSDSYPSAQSLAHHINPAMLAGLTNQLYKAATQFYICVIGASNFEMGNNLSEKTTQHAKEAAAFIKGWINQQ